MKILYLITDLDIGGAEQALCGLVRGLSRRDFHPVVACLTGAGELGAVLADQDVPVCYVRMRNRLDVSAVFRVASLLRSYRPDVLHTFLFHANLVGRLAAWLAGTPVVISSARVAEPRQHHLWLDGWTHRLANIETCVSDGVRDYLLRNRVMPERKLVTVANGVDMDEVSVDRSTLREELGLDGKTPIVLSIGRLTKQKGMSDLLSAAALVVEKRQDAAFVIAGEGPLRARLERKAQASGLAPRVHFLGFRRDVPNLIAGADIVAVPSLWEGMANVVLEAMAGATPVVATDVEGCGELVVPGETGLLVPKRRPEALAQAIASLLSDGAKRQRMGKAARHRVVSDHTLKQTIEANTALYRRHIRLSQSCSPADIWGRRRLA